jgi:putative aldouronate transport system substrate-binding protein
LKKSQIYCFLGGILMKKCIAVLCVLFLAGAMAFAGGQSQRGAGSGSPKGQPVQINVEVFDRGTDGGRSDVTTNNWTSWIQEKLLKEENIAVTFVAVSRWDEVPSLNNLMAAGNAPDVCLTYDGNLIVNYRDLGGLYDMQPNIERLMPDLKRFLGPDSSLPGKDLIYRNQDTETKQVFSIPARRMNVAMDGTFIRKDWLDKLGLAIPKTTQEFYDTMLAFKEKDPGGVGKEKMMPFTLLSNFHMGVDTIPDSFVDPNLSRKDMWINEIAGRRYLWPGYKEGIRFMNKMYNAGLINRDFPLNTAAQDLERDVKSGLAGCYIRDWDHAYRDSPGIYQDLVKNIPTAELVPIDPFTNSRGVATRRAHDPAGVNFFIPAFSKNPEAAMRYVNWLSRDENKRFLQIGPEGVTHDIVSGVPKLKPAAGLWIQNSPQNLDYTISVNGLDVGDPELNIKVLANSYTVPAHLIIDAYNMATKNTWNIPVIPVTLSAAGPYAATLADKGNQLITEAITCAPGQFDRVWDAGIADWMASGGQVILEERKAKYIE